MTLLKSWEVSWRSHMHSFAVCVVATYSALAVDKVTSSCLRDVMRPVLFISFLDYWQVTLIWSPCYDKDLHD